jgi:HSP20 family protein
MSKNLLAQWSQIQRKLAGLSEQIAHPEDPSAWMPNTDVYDAPQGLVVKVEMAGVACEEVQVMLDARELVIQGQRRDPHCDAARTGYRFRQMEIEYGPFRRVIPLPYPVSAEKARARCQDGVLEIRLPRTRHASSRRVAIMLRVV